VEWVNELYGRWKMAASIDERKERVLEIAKKYGIEGEEVQYDARHDEVSILHRVSGESEDKLKEVAQWILGSDFIVDAVHVYVTDNFHLSRNRHPDDVVDRAKKVGLQSYGFVDHGSGYDYDDYFLIDEHDGVKVFLVVSNHR